MSAAFTAFAQFFNMITMLFSAGEKGASALNHLASAGDHHANAYHQEARIKSEKKLHLLEVDLAKTKADNVA